ncbi:peptide ligase PGM1-related protein [Streptomyces sp. NPDC059851]|uniref:preATP grasp domain-containing protein n=1 Tax=Streptomyces sp. NPDC059851 TaxID=3346971 RepID=UPI00364A841C
MIVYANLVSDLAVDLAQRHVLRAWAELAPREVWVLRPGDVLVSPVPVGEAFLRYACGLTGVPPESVAVVVLARAFETVSGCAALPEVVRAVRKASEGRDAGAVLPTALDAPAVALARGLGVPVAPYPSAEAAEAALGITRSLNTKAVFRNTAAGLGMRLPDGRVCRREGLADAMGELLRVHEQVVVKPDRSAGGHGLRFLSAAAGAASLEDLPAVGGAEGLWVVEERVDVARAVSIQMVTGPAGPRPVFSGEMRTLGGTFAGYLSPLPAPLQENGPTLERWGMALGRHLAAHGYAGPFSLDAMVSAGGELFAGESNVRRTATTTPYAMVARLAANAGASAAAWATGTVRTPRRYGFDEAVDRLCAERIAYDPARGEGVVLYADVPPDGLTWRYTVIADSHASVARYEGLLRASWAPVP